MKRFITAFGLVIALLVPFQGVSASSREHITEFATVATLSEKNILSVQETITVDFAGVSHHGIYRTIPIIQHDHYTTYYYAFDLKGVSSPTGASAAVASQTESGDYEVIQIGSANRTISGVETYVIRYTLTPIALDTGTDNRVILNVTGQDWEYPIDSATLDLTLPTTSSSEPACYTGITGSTEQNCSLTAVGKKIQARTLAVLEPGEGMTIDARLPSGSFTTYLEPNQAPPLTTVQWAGAIMATAAWLLGFIVILVYIGRWWRRRHQKRTQTVYAQYESPNGLKPGEIGLLIDSKSNMTEFTATLIDLAVRGYLKINQSEKTLLGFKSDEYTFDKLKPGDDLTPYERSVYSLIFSGANHTTLSTISDTSRANTNRAAIKKMRDDLAKDLKTRGYYTPQSNLLYSGGWIFVPVGFVMAFIGFSAIGLSPVIFGLLALACVLAGAIALHWTPRLTPEGLAEWAKVDGFKLYLSMAEKDRLNFSDAPERTPERFNALLPYAVALGVEKKWAKQFEGIDVTPTNNWYVGNNMAMINSAAFASSFASSFSSSVNSSFAGSSGGGSAGGGGGGGGGGGW